MPRYIQPVDLAPFATIDPAKAMMMIDDCEAMATLAAPCLATLADTDTPESAAAIKAVRAVLRGALLRWYESGSGAVTQSTVGQVSQTTAPRRSMFWPSELEQLRSICSSAETGKAFAVDTVADTGGHSLLCSRNFGGPCSCGFDIAGEPIYEVD
jgi:hypothetical protein